MQNFNNVGIDTDLAIRFSGGTYWLEVFSGPFKGQRLNSYGSGQIASAVADLRREGYNVRMTPEVESQIGGATPLAASTTSSRTLPIGTRCCST